MLLKACEKTAQSLPLSHFFLCSRVVNRSKLDLPLSLSVWSAPASRRNWAHSAAPPSCSSKALCPFTWATMTIGVAPCVVEAFGSAPTSRSFFSPGVVWSGVAVKKIRRETGNRGVQIQQRKQERHTAGGKKRCRVSRVCGSQTDRRSRAHRVTVRFH